VPNLIINWGKNLSRFFSRPNKKLKQLKQQSYFDRHLINRLSAGKWPSCKQLKHFHRVLNRDDKRKLIAVAAVAVICFILLIAKLYLLITVTVPIRGGEYSEGLIGSPRLINPILAQNNDVDMDLSRLIFSGLMKFDKNHALIADLTDSYEISGDQLNYTFHLKQNVKWHDNEPFKADDVVFTIASIQDSQFKSPLARQLSGVAAEKLDDYTVKLTLKTPFAPFLSMLTFGILPEHLWYSIAPANADLTELNKKPVGTGPWKFDSFKKDSSGIIKSYNLTPNRDYYGAQPYLTKIIFKFFGDFPSALEALKNKNVDGLAYLPKEFQSDLQKNKNINYWQIKQPQYLAIFFNQKKNELLAADYIRQALALALDKNKLLSEVWSGAGEVIDAPTLPGIGNNPEIKKYGYDPAAAAELLEKNGWILTATTTADGLTEQIRKKKDWYLTVALTVMDQQQNTALAQKIKEAWERIGVKTTVNIIDKSKIIQDVINGRKYEALIFSENIGVDPDPFSFWHSSQNEYPGLNLAIFTDKTADQLLEASRVTNDWAKRQEYYKQFQKIISQRLPAIFLYNAFYTYPQDKEIKGFDTAYIAVPADRFSDLKNWYRKTKRVWK